MPDDLSDEVFQTQWEAMLQGKDPGWLGEQIASGRLKFPTEEVRIEFVSADRRFRARASLTSSGPGKYQAKVSPRGAGEASEDSPTTSMPSLDVTLPKQVHEVRVSGLGLRTRTTHHAPRSYGRHSVEAGCFAHTCLGAALTSATVRKGKRGRPDPPAPNDQSPVAG